MISTKELKEGDLCWIWIENPDLFENDQWQRQTPEIKRKAIFNGKVFITRYNKNILHDDEIYGSSVYKFKKDNRGSNCETFIK